MYGSSSRAVVMLSPCRGRVCFFTHPAVQWVIRSGGKRVYGSPVLLFAEGVEYSNRVQELTDVHRRQDLLPEGGGCQGGPVRTCALVDVSLAGDGDCVFFEEKAVECAGIPPVFDHVPEIDFADAVDVVPESM